MSTTGGTHDGNTDAPANLFAITAKPPALRLTAGDSGTISFTVSFTNPPLGVSVPFSAHANLVPQDPPIASWLTLDGPPGHRFSPNSTEVYTVRIAVPAGAAPGNSAFRLDMVGDENPDEQYTQGPSVALEIAPAPVPKAKPPYWLWAIIAALVLLVGGTAITFALTHRGQPPTPTPDPTPSAMSGINFEPVDKNNVRITFVLSKAGTARVRYATSADLVSGNTVDAMNTSGNAFAATFGVNRETQYFYQITVTDRSGTTTTTLVKPFRIARIFTITLTTVTLKKNHAMFAAFPVSGPSEQPAPRCTPTYSFVETIGYAGVTPDARSFTFPAELAPTVPKVYPINHVETIEEDPARAITLTVSGAFAQEGGLAGCRGPLVRASVTLTPAEDWGVGKANVPAESEDFQVAFTIRDQLMPQFSA